jgi:metal-responsive CopG/Arc/MetJ family transcriptional regulator
MQLTEKKIHPATKQYWKNIGKGIKRVNIDIPERIWKNVEEEAKIQGVKKREIVIDALIEYLKKSKYKQ